MNWTFKSKLEDNEEAKETIEIVNKLLDRTDVERMISPKSDEYFLIDRVNEYCMVIGHDKIILANHKFSTTVELGLSFTEKVKSIVRDRLEDERQALKETLFENKIDLLKRIKDSI